MQIRMIFLFGLAALIGCNDSKDTNANAPATQAASLPAISYTLDATYPHDTTSFTEGLLFHDGQLYEATGAPDEMPQTRSLFGTVDLHTGHITPKAEIDRKKYFGEGIVFLNGKVYQLTYQTKVGFVYDAKTFQKLGQFTFPSAEGWGMTTDGKSLIMSDGTDVLTWLDPQTFATVKVVHVSDMNGPVQNVNELEYINGAIYANIYTTNRIIRIDPSNGNVTAAIDLSALADQARSKYSGSLEMNGIAYDSTSGKMYVTGKMWPEIYAISLK